jgi:hypothetical protein
MLDGAGEPEGETERGFGVAGREISVEGMREYCESWDRAAWESILPSAAEWPKPRQTRQKRSGWRLSSAGAALRWISYDRETMEMDGIVRRGLLAGCRRPRGEAEAVQWAAQIGLRAVASRRA